MNNQINTELKLNSNGDFRGMSPNSQKNLGKGRLGNNHASKDVSITRIQRDMMGQLCPYAKDPAWTWAQAIADAGMRDALTEEKARENLKDRLEGKVTLPIGGDAEKPLLLEIIVQDKETKELTEKLVSGELP